MVAARSAAAGPRAVPLQVTIASPRPIFMQLSGLGPSLSGDRVVWTATNGEGQTGSEADRIYAYDLDNGRMSVPVRSQFGATGFIGGYVLVGNTLAYIDTGSAPGGIMSWRVALLDLRTNRTQTVASSTPNTTTTVPPQLAFDGTRLLLLQTADTSSTQRQSTVTLFTPAQHRQQVLARVPNLLLGDPALAGETALWTEISFGTQSSSRLVAYDLTHEALHPVRVGDVSQVAASGDLVVWKSGMSGTGGHIGLYSLSRNRVIANDLAHSNAAIFPSISGHMIGWTYGDGSRVQVYSLSSSRVIYNAPRSPSRVYGPTAISGHGVSWVYTVLMQDKSSPHGYVVVRQIR